MFTIVYCMANKFPRETFKKAYTEATADLALYAFVNEPEHINHFVVCIVAGPPTLVSHTR